VQGFVIARWIAVEVVMLRAVVWAHCVYWAAVGAVLIVCGLVLRGDKPAAACAPSIPMSSRPG